MLTSKGKPTSEDEQVAAMVHRLRTGTFSLHTVDPISATAPKGTQVRRIAAYNALMDLAVPGRDKYCGTVGLMLGPCVLKQDHEAPMYDDGASLHMDVEQRDRALRYLVHSDPDATKRA
jgi:hypothetical protein